MAGYIDTLECLRGKLDTVITSRFIFEGVLFLKKEKQCRKNIKTTLNLYRTQQILN